MIRKVRFIINSYWKVQGKQENPLSYMYIYDRKQIQFFFHSNFCHRYTHIYDDIGCFYNSHVCVWEPLNILFFSRLGAMGIRTHDLRILCVLRSRLTNSTNAESTLRGLYIPGSLLQGFLIPHIFLTEFTQECVTPKHFCELSLLITRNMEIWKYDSPKGNHCIQNKII